MIAKGRTGGNAKNGKREIHTCLQPRKSCHAEGTEIYD